MMLPGKDYMRSCPEFMHMVDLVSKQNPLQKKRVYNFISGQDGEYLTYAEKICKKLKESFFQSEQEQIEAAASYNRMSMDFLREQILFSKTGVYHLDDARVAHENVYSRPEVMRYYMVGLLMSYLLWPNHYKMLHFLKEHIRQISIGNYLEIAPGHGLFAAEVLQQFPDIKARLLDISTTSLQVTTDILATFEIGSDRFSSINGDFLTVPIEDTRFDFISMGEVLEHVNDALGFLQRARSLLNDHGTIFMTTCANCPAIDHIYHFHNEDEIRDLIHEAGLYIAKERVLLVEAVPREQCHHGLVPSNYCAILTKEKNDSL